MVHAPLFLQGLTEYWLSQNEWEKAEEQAQKLCELSALPPDPPYVAMGHRLLAKAAMGRKAWDKALEEIEQAVVCLNKVEAPLVEWQVYATAAELNGKTGRFSEADAYRRRSAAILLSLAASMDEADPLRQSLLQHPLLNVVGVKDAAE